MESSSGPQPVFAGVGSRVASTLIDSLLFAPFCVLMLRAQTQSRTAVGWWVVVIWTVWLAYILIGYRKWGQTIGKHVMRTRLVDANGELPSMRRLVLRCIPFAAAGLAVYIPYWQTLGRMPASAFGDISWTANQTLLEELTPAWGDLIEVGYWLFLAVACVSILVHPRKQSLHDLFAGTFVLQLEKPWLDRTPEATLSRPRRVLITIDYGVSVLFGLGAGLFALAAWGAQMSGDAKGVREVLLVSAACAVIAILNFLASLTVRSRNEALRWLTHIAAYLVAVVPVGLVILGFAMGTSGAQP